MNEFANMLFDKLESSSPEAARVIRETFGGVLVNQIISQENDFTSERQEPFNMITLTVQGKSNLVESFETLVAGDLLTGDNKYQLPDGTKVCVCVFVVKKNSERPPVGRLKGSLSTAKCICALLRCCILRRGHYDKHPE